MGRAIKVDGDGHEIQPWECVAHYRIQGRRIWVPAFIQAMNVSDGEAFDLCRDWHLLIRAGVMASPAISSEVLYTLVAEQQSSGQNWQRSLKAVYRAL